MLTERFERALVFAAQLHKHQRRKASNVPYLSHLLAVAGLVIEYGGNEDQAIAALIHDAIEDQGGPSTRDEIACRFGNRVAEIVDECTDTDANPKPPWYERKKSHIKRLGTASQSARLISTADKLHNVRSILRDYAEVRDQVWHRFQGGKDGTLWYYRAVADVLLSAESTSLTKELSYVVATLEEAVISDK